MSINLSAKLSDYISSSKKGISDEEWIALLEKGYTESNDEEMAEALMAVSAEADNLIMNDTN